MGKIYYTIRVDGQVVAHDVDSDFVADIVKGLLSVWCCDYNLCLTVEAQEKPYHLESAPPNPEA